MHLHKNNECHASANNPSALCRSLLWLTMDQDCFPVDTQQSLVMRHMMRRSAQSGIACSGAQPGLSGGGLHSIARLPKCCRQVFSGLTRSLVQGLQACAPCEVALPSVQTRQANQDERRPRKLRHAIESAQGLRTFCWSGADNSLPLGEAMKAQQTVTVHECAHRAEECCTG